jgi:hypothetical protein
MEDSGSSQRTNSTSEGPDISDDPHPHLTGFFSSTVSMVINFAAPLV